MFQEMKRWFLKCKYSNSNFFLYKACAVCEGNEKVSQKGYSAPHPPDPQHYKKHSEV